MGTAGCRAIGPNQRRGDPRRIAVVPAGERWPSDGSLRPAFEDWVGAGAIISHLAGARSPEAHAAATIFEGVQSDLAALLQSCGSGKELLAHGIVKDVALAWTQWTDNSCTSWPSRRETGSRCVRTRWRPGNYGSGTFEYTYDVEVEPEPVVFIRAVGIKERERVRIGREVIDL
jgi:hypothetical protein